MHNKNFYHVIITLLTFVSLNSSAIADEITLQKNHPESYVVVKGDTLWDISAKFLKDPWLWPQIWKMNRDEIKNPHWIYPGDLIVLDTSSGSPQLRLLHETVTLEPGVRVEPLDKEAIKSISPNVITPFLNRPLLIENNKLDTAPRIIAGPDNRLVLSPGTRVYVNNIPEGANQHWDIYRPGEPFIDPDTGELLGTEAIYLGDLDVVRYGEPASANILHAEEEIFTKDRLVPASNEFQTNFIPHAPDTMVKGRILRIYGGVAEAGPNSVVSINLGKSDGLEEGHVLAINRYGRIIRDPEAPKTTPKTKLKELNFDVKKDADGKPVVNFEKKPPNKTPELQPGEVKLPDERVGLLMIFRTFDRVSYGLVMNASDPIHTLDQVETP